MDSIDVAKTRTVDRSERTEPIPAWTTILRYERLVVNLLRHGNVPADAADVEERWAESAATLRTFNETFVGHEQLYAIITPKVTGPVSG